MVNIKIKSSYYDNVASLNFPIKMLLVYIVSQIFLYIGYWLNCGFISKWHKQINEIWEIESKYPMVLRFSL